MITKERNKGIDMSTGEFHLLILKKLINLFLFERQRMKNREFQCIDTLPKCYEQGWAWAKLGAQIPSLMCVQELKTSPADFLH